MRRCYCDQISCYQIDSESQNKSFSICWNKMMTQLVGFFIIFKLKLFMLVTASEAKTEIYYFVFLEMKITMDAKIAGIF